jgi:hypothetical protein
MSARARRALGAVEDMVGLVDYDVPFKASASKQ